MEYVSIKTLILSAKEVYFVLKFVYTTYDTASHRDEELHKLRAEFFTEATVFTAFAQQFLSSAPEEYGPKCMLWIPLASDIYAKLQGLFAQNYQKVALLQNPEYQNFSQQYNNFLIGDPDAFQVQGIQSGWQIEDGDTSPSLLALPSSSSPNGISASQNVSSMVIASPTTVQSVAVNISLSGPSKETSLAQRVKHQVTDKWDRFDFAVRNKKNLEKILAEMRSLRKELQDLIPSVMLTHPQSLKSLFENIASHPAQSSVLGMPCHANIQRIAATTDTGTVTPISVADSATMQYIKKDLVHLFGYRVEPTESATLVVGKLIDHEDIEEDILVEYKSWQTSGSQTEGHVKRSKEDITKLGQVLASAQRPFFPTLKLRGYIDQEPQKRFAFVFDFPEDSDGSMPLTLHDMISGKVDVPGASELDLRFHIARVLGKGIGAFHTDGWVHESICSQSVVIFKNSRSRPDLGKPYLINFEYARLSGGDTSWLSKKVVERHLYQHPDRFTSNPKKFHQGHDLYSLGVVLLELGLWRTASDIYEAHRDKTLSKDPNTLRCSPDATCGVEVTGQSSCMAELSNGFVTKAEAEPAVDFTEAQTIFISVAEAELPKHMGPDYTRAVVACLSEQHAQRFFGDQLGLGLMKNINHHLDEKKLGERWS